MDVVLQFQERSKKKQVLLVISLTGIKVCSSEGKVSYCNFNRGMQFKDMLNRPIHVALTDIYNLPLNPPIFPQTHTDTYLLYYLLK